MQNNFYKMEQNNKPTQIPNKLNLIRNEWIDTNNSSILEITNVNNNDLITNKLPSIISANDNDFDDIFKSPPFKRTKTIIPNMIASNTCAFSLTSTDNRKQQKKQKKQINSISNAKNVFNYDANK